MDQKPQWLQNEAICNYFNTLPAFIQENIMQCGSEFNSVEELRTCAQNLQQS